MASDILPPPGVLPELDWYTVPQIARGIRIREAKLIADIRAGKLAGINISEGTRPRYRIARQALAEYLENKQVRPAPRATRRSRQRPAGWVDYI